jgi:hypothetical protein
MDSLGSSKDWMSIKLSILPSGDEMGNKLPESERPTFESIHRKLNEKVSHSIQKFFVPDIQNDCSCNIESYDSGQEVDVLCLTSCGIKCVKVGTLHLPMWVGLALPSGPEQS